MGGWEGPVGGEGNRESRGADREGLREGNSEKEGKRDRVGGEEWAEWVGAGSENRRGGGRDGGS